MAQTSAPVPPDEDPGGFVPVGADSLAEALTDPSDSVYAEYSGAGSTHFVVPMSAMQLPATPTPAKFYFRMQRSGSSGDPIEFQVAFGTFPADTSGIAHMFNDSVSSAGAITWSAAITQNPQDFEFDMLLRWWGALFRLDDYYFLFDWQNSDPSFVPQIISLSVELDDPAPTRPAKPTDFSTEYDGVAIQSEWSSGESEFTLERMRWGG